MRMLLAAALFVALAPGGFPPRFARADENAEKLLADADVALKDRDYKKATERAREAVRLEPKNVNAHYLLGLALLGGRDNEAAVAAFREVLRLDPIRVEVHDRLGDALLKSGQFKEAVAAFDKFLESKPDFAADHWRRGIALYYAGKYEEGKKQFDLHRTVNPVTPSGRGMR